MVTVILESDAPHEVPIINEFTTLVVDKFNASLFVDDAEPNTTLLLKFWAKPNEIQTKATNKIKKFLTCMIFKTHYIDYFWWRNIMTFI